MPQLRPAERRSLRCSSSRCVTFKSVLSTFEKQGDKLKQVLLSLQLWTSIVRHITGQETDSVLFVSPLSLGDNENSAPSGISCIFADACSSAREILSGVVTGESPAIVSGRVGECCDGAHPYSHAGHAQVDFDIHLACIPDLHVDHAPHFWRSPFTSITCVFPASMHQDRMKCISIGVSMTQFSLWSSAPWPPCRSHADGKVCWRWAGT